MDKKLITCSLFLDLRKAYDTINHTILIKKLEKYGIRGLLLQLLASYLTDRQQYTIVNQYKSKSRDVICGIPQGSTLGPLLFNIYISDLPLASNSTIHLFADDTNLTLSHSNVSTPEVESSRTSLASRTSSRTHFEVLGPGLGLEGQVLGLGLEASSPRKLACPRLEDSAIFWNVKILWSA